MNASISAKNNHGMFKKKFGPPSPSVNGLSESHGGVLAPPQFLKMDLINVPLILSKKSFGSVAKTCVETFLRKNEIYR